MLRSISEILKEVHAAPTKEQRIQILRSYNNHFALKHVLRGAFDPSIVWRLPKGKMEYTPCPYVDQHNMLIMEAKRLYVFTEGGNPNLTNEKVNKLFIQLLESLDPEDANLMIHVKEKKLPYKNVTSELVLEAFQGLF